jgi:large subunit ribosomal protein L4
MTALGEPRTFAERRRARLAPVTVERRSMTGDVLGEVQLDPEVFSVPVNVPLLHQVVTAQLAARRAGTQSTRTRAEVSGGSKKPYRQKGTGNARQGSIRAPHYSGGGIALGPKPRSYAQRTPSKMIRQALRCALSDRAAGGQVVLVDAWGFEVPRTREAAAALAALGCSGDVLVVLERDDEVAARSFANLPHVGSVPADQLTAYDVMSADCVVFTDATLPATHDAGAGGEPTGGTVPAASLTARAVELAGEVLGAELAIAEAVTELATAGMAAAERAVALASGMPGEASSSEAPSSEAPSSEAPSDAEPAGEGPSGVVPAGDDEAGER